MFIGEFREIVVWLVPVWMVVIQREQVLAGYFLTTTKAGLHVVI